MKIILTQEVKNLGDAGAIVNVADGYARNYLLPRSLAVPATPGAIKQVQERATASAKRITKEEDRLRSFADQIAQQSFTLYARVGTGGRLFGSITAADIAEKLSQQVGQDIDRRKVDLTEPIRQIGTYRVPIRLVGKLVPQISVTVEGEGGETAAPVSDDTISDAPSPDTITDVAVAETEEQPS